MRTLIFTSIILLCSFNTDPLFINNEKTIEITEQRIKNIKEYTRIRYGKEQVQVDPKVIVIHSTENRGIDAAENIKEYFTSDALSGWPYRSWAYIRQYGRLNVGTQFMIDRDGTVYRLTPDLIIGRHCIGIDYCSIGIENIGYNDLTEEQLYANVKLIEYLKAKYPSITYVIGHYEYRKLEKTDLWKEKTNMRTIKKDPGAYFMMRLRRNLEINDITVLAP